jgi:hypothetical protein
MVAEDAPKRIPAPRGRASDARSRSRRRTHAGALVRAPQAVIVVARRTDRRRAAGRAHPGAGPMW